MEVLANNMHAMILYEFKLGKTAAEGHRNLVKAFGENCVSYSTCSDWFHKFKEGDFDLSNHHPGRHSVVDEQVLIQLMETDPNMTSHALAEKFGCSSDTVCHHLHNIGMVYEGGKWVKK
ncbi:unnamed protein product [Bursaphelenchus okinawaensis]|uniref:Mos1 transposase HTH domain-containing protein n=1 Tax=Bursaphelenchus okinawaensis TaxID=465554 RepID=A0A811JSS8_9BILA|nr:unnamed protein product [Bursaphelenchus okinawaensis]CAG9081216.1 unnamed protein product [Bursaphelenchus okinawaensis]